MYYGFLPSMIHIKQTSKDFFQPNYLNWVGGSFIVCTIIVVSFGEIIVLFYKKHIRDLYSFASINNNSNNFGKSHNY